VTSTLLGVLLGVPDKSTKLRYSKMAKLTKPLTNTEVKQAKPKDKIYKLSDGGGLLLRVKPI
jgi:hypothetical protein